MVTSRELGRFIGPVTVLLFISEIVNLHIWSNGNSPQLNYLNGFVLLILGFSIVSTHNIWTLRWPVLITMTGWFSTLLGLYRMFFPEVPQAGDNTVTMAVLLILIVIELIVTYESYRPENNAGKS